MPPFFRATTRGLSLLAGAVSLLSLIDATLPLEAQTTPVSADSRYLERAKRILSKTPLIDGHNDLPWRIREDSIARGNVDAYDLSKRAPGHTDLERLRKGMVGAQFWHAHGGGVYVAWYLPLYLMATFRPNLAERIATTMVSEGWWQARERTRAAAAQAGAAS